MIKDGWDAPDLSNSSIAPTTNNQQPTTNNLINDNWYAQYPDKILGEPYTASGRFGEVTKYKGKISDVDRIPAPLDFLQMEKESNPTLSFENESITELITEPETSQNIDAALEGTKKETIIKQIKRHSKKPAERVIATNPVKDADMWTFEEVFKANNPEVSLEELRVFVWWSSLGKYQFDPGRLGEVFRIEPEYSKIINLEQY